MLPWLDEGYPKAGEAKHSKARADKDKPTFASKCLHSFRAELNQKSHRPSYSTRGVPSVPDQGESSNPPMH